MMKSFVEKYAAALLWTMGVLLISLLTLCVFIFLAFRADANARASVAMLRHAELESTVENLQEALEAEDEQRAYHYAASAAETAALAGERETAILFERMAEDLLASSRSMETLRETLKQYLLTGETQVEVEQTEETQEESKAVSLFHVENAERCVRRLFGDRNTLRRGMKSRNGTLLFSCSNAYAVIDEKTGLPVEAAISLEPSEKRLDADACVNSAIRFLEEFFPNEVVANASVQSIAEDGVSGTFEIAFVSQNRRMLLSVRRDNGRVARLTAK